MQRKHKKIFQVNQRNRELCKEKLVSGHYSPLQYVKAISHTFDSSLRALENAPLDDRLGLETNEEEVEQEDNVEQHEDQTTEARRAVCVICQGPRDNPVLYLPCRHALVCGTCDTHFNLHTPCPFCRSPVEQKIHNIFM